MTRARKVRLIIYLVYLLILAAAALALYYFIPADVIDAIRSTYMSGTPDGL